MKRHLLFYGGQLVEDSGLGRAFMQMYLHTNWGLEIYNGGVVCEYTPSGSHWFKPDFTPMLPEDVPKEYILMELLLR